MNRARFTHIWPELAICSASSAARGERLLGESVATLAAAALRAPIVFDMSAIHSCKTQPCDARLSVCAPSGTCTQQRRRRPTLGPRYVGRVVGMAQGRSAPRPKPRAAQQRRRRASTLHCKVTPVRRYILGVAAGVWFAFQAPKKAKEGRLPTAQIPYLRRAKGQNSTTLWLVPQPEEAFLWSKREARPLNSAALRPLATRRQDWLSDPP